LINARGDRVSNTAKTFEQDVSEVLDELRAQSEIITTIGKLGSKDKADRVMQAINCLVRADQLVPGILAQFIRGQKKP